MISSKCTVHQCTEVYKQYTILLRNVLHPAYRGKGHTLRYMGGFGCSESFLTGWLDVVLSCFTIGYKPFVCPKSLRIGMGKSGEIDINLLF